MSTLLRPYSFYKLPTTALFNEATTLRKFHSNLRGSKENSGVLPNSPNELKIKLNSVQSVGARGCGGVAAYEASPGRPIPHGAGGNYRCCGNDRRDRVQICN